MSRKVVSSLTVSHNRYSWLSGHPPYKAMEFAAKFGQLNLTAHKYH